MRKTYQNKWSILGSVVSLVMVLTLIVSCAPAVTPPEEVKTAKVGFLAPLSGEVAAWGLPGLYGAEIWVEDVNAAGGIQVGDEKYMVEMIPYDNEYVSSKALLGAKKLVLEDKVSFVLMMGGSTVLATQPFFTEHEMLVATLIPGDMSTGTPYLIAPAEGFPMYMIGGIEYIKETHPEIKTVAIVSQDDPIGRIAIAYSEAAFESLGIEVVYKKIFGVETTDFAPIVTAMLASKPDLLSWGDSYPAYVAPLTEQAYLQGWDGPIISCELILSDVLAKVPAEWLEGAVSYFPDWDDPNLPEECHEFYAEYISRWPESWGAVSWEYAAGLEVWKLGVEKAGSIEPMAVFEALKAEKTIYHPFGEGTWWGKELWGVDNWLGSPWPVTEVRNGKHALVDMKSFVDWFNKHGDILVRVLEEEEI